MLRAAAHAHRLRLFSSECHSSLSFPELRFEHHLISDFGAEGEALASAWEPTNPHDEALLIATVPKLHGKSTPMYAGGKPPAQPWCGAKLSLRGYLLLAVAVVVCWLCGSVVAVEP